MCDEERSQLQHLKQLLNTIPSPDTEGSALAELMYTAYDGTWVGTSTKQCPQQLLEIVEHGIKEGLFGEPFEGPLYEHADEDEE